MKTSTYAFALAAIITTSAANAENYKNPAFSFTASTASVYATVEGSRNDGIQEFEFGVNALTYSLSDTSLVTSTLYSGYNRSSENLTLGVETALVTTFDDVLVYGSVATEYTSSINTLRGGNFYVTPEVGVGYGLTDSLAVYASANYTFDASNSFSRQGGSAELGLNYSITNEWSASPYITRSFDTDNNQTQLGIRVGYNF